MLQDYVENLGLGFKRYLHKIMKKGVDYRHVKVLVSPPERGNKFILYKDTCYSYCIFKSGIKNKYLGSAPYQPGALPTRSERVWNSASGHVWNTPDISGFRVK